MLYEKIVCYTSAKKKENNITKSPPSLKQQVKVLYFIFYIMSYNDLLSPERAEFVFKIQNEMYNLILIEKV